MQEVKIAVLVVAEPLRMLSPVTVDLLRLFRPCFEETSPAGIAFHAFSAGLRVRHSVDYNIENHAQPERFCRGNEILEFLVGSSAVGSVEIVVMVYRIPRERHLRHQLNRVESQHGDARQIRLEIGECRIRCIGKIGVEQNRSDASLPDGGVVCGGSDPSVKTQAVFRVMLPEVLDRIVPRSVENLDVIRAEKQGNALFKSSGGIMFMGNVKSSGMICTFVQ